MADSLLSHEGAILTENAADMADARGHISDVMLDRLRLDHDRLAGMADGVRAIAALPDHTGRVLSEVRRPNGLVIQKVQVPLGLVSIIYESRPNVTSDAAALALKSGNVCVLRSGREAYRTARAIVQALKAGIAAEGGDPDILNIVDDTTHQSAADIMTAKGLVDLLIPRGGAGLIRACVAVELRLDERAAAVIPGTPAGERDFDTEFLDYILAVKIVDSVDEAIAHIAAHSTGHSEAIVTEDPAHADAFVNRVDSAAVYVNASTRFTDGGEFGLGCEMGISTQKLHARGPMGLDELTTYKYVIRGNGQIR